MVKKFNIFNFVV